MNNVAGRKYLETLFEHFRFEYPRLREAVEITVRNGGVSIPLLQRGLKIDYDTATKYAKLIEENKVLIDMSSLNEEALKERVVMLEREVQQLQNNSGYHLVMAAFSRFETQMEELQLKLDRMTSHMQLPSTLTISQFCELTGYDHQYVLNQLDIVKGTSVAWFRKGGFDLAFYRPPRARERRCTLNDFLACWKTLGYENYMAIDKRGGKSLSDVIRPQRNRVIENY